MGVVWVGCKGVAGGLRHHMDGGAPAGTGTPPATPDARRESEGIAVSKSTDPVDRIRPQETEVSWSFRVTSAGPTVWDWSNGDPDIDALLPFRSPQSGAASRHVPVRGYSLMAKDHLCLESGLEHDLLRFIERLPGLAAVVPQPAQLRWLGDVNGANPHVPDLLTLVTSGEVTVWDAKSQRAAEQEQFQATAELTRAACAAVGWHYEVFTGLSGVHRHNLLWLHSYRTPPAWTPGCREEVLGSAALDGMTLGQLLDADEQTVAVVWHLIWAGELDVDLTQRLTPEVPVRAAT